MNLTLFFSPLPEELYTYPYSYSTLFKSISLFDEKMPSHKGADIALIGVQENVSDTSRQSILNGADEVRKKLYALKKGSGSYKIIDLGNLRIGHDIHETHGRLREVCRMLLDNNILPIIIGNSHDQDLAQYKAYKGMKKLIHFLNVDAMLDWAEDGSSLSENHIQHILVHEAQHLFGYTHLAYQSYLMNPENVEILEKLYFEAYRIGQFRSHKTDMEPAIRQADLLSFDITAIRSADAPGNPRAQPFGLSAEEACQICWYAGQNEKLTSLGIYEYHPDLDDSHKKTASVMATMIWYFIEGFYHRKEEKNFKQNDFLRYVVTLPNDPKPLVFYKSKLTEKWWMEITRLSKNPYENRTILPCSYTDYQKATQGEVPERYLYALQKLS